VLRLTRDGRDHTDAAGHAGHAHGVSADAGTSALAELWSRFSRGA
jgi:hypothetical protein